MKNMDGEKLSQEEFKRVFWFPEMINSHTEWASAPMTKHLNSFPKNIHVIQEENSTVIQYDAICEGKRRFCQYIFRGLYEFESINGQEITLKEI